MTNQEHIEQLFKTIDTGALIYSQAKELSYLDGIASICESILNQEPVSGLDLDEKRRIQQLITDCALVKYQKEAIRKAMQLAILKGLKASGKSNELITPDTLGIFLAYLIKKLIPQDRPLLLLDPLAGTGNLVATIMNQLSQDVMAILVEQDEQIAKIARLFLAMLEYNDDVFCQDTLTFRMVQADVLITDFSFPETDMDSVFPYQVLAHHQENLQEDAHVIAIVPDAFFAPEHQERFKTELLSAYQAVGLIRLPQDLFYRKRKSVLILKKGHRERTSEQPFLMAEIPSFVDQDALRPVLEKINQWFQSATTKKGI